MRVPGDTGVVGFNANHLIIALRTRTVGMYHSPDMAPSKADECLRENHDLRPGLANLPTKVGQAGRRAGREKEQSLLPPTSGGPTSH